MTEIERMILELEKRFADHSGRVETRLDGIDHRLECIDEKLQKKTNISPKNLYDWIRIIIVLLIILSALGGPVIGFLNHLGVKTIEQIPMVQKQLEQTQKLEQTTKSADDNE